MLIDPDALSHVPGAMPLYRQIADQIRTRIVDGDLITGDTVPREQVLAKEVGVSRMTIREAFNLLTGEGLLLRAQGRSTTVRAEPPSRHIEPSRYQEELEQARAMRDGLVPDDNDVAPTSDDGSRWDGSAHSFVKLAELHTTTTSETASRLLRVPVGTPLLRRVFVRYAHGVPVQIRISCMSVRQASGTEIMDEARLPWPGGTIGELVHLGIEPTRVRERLRSRMPATWEADTLMAPRKAQLWEFTRVFYAGYSPVEASELLMEATGTTLDWDTKLT